LWMPFLFGLNRLRSQPEILRRFKE
jgi:hypothetical protein